MIVARLTPHEELVRRIRVDAEKRIARIPAPVILNIDALVGFLQPREFTLGGVGYRAPPLRYRDGVRLQVVANTLKGLRDAGATVEQRRVPLAVAAALLRPLLSPIARWRRAWFHRVFTLSVDEMTDLLWRMLDVPDQSPVMPPTGPVTMDWIDELVGFARAFPPTWLDEDGMPRYWAQYLYGVRHLGRARHREDLRLAQATRAAQFVQADFDKWVTEYRAAAGW